MVILPLPRRRSNWAARAGLGIAAVALADLGLYAYLTAQTGGPVGEGGRGLGSRALFVGGFLALLALLGLVGMIAHRPGLRMGIYGFTAAGSLGLGVLGMDSIGPPLLVVTALSMVALAQIAERSWGPITTGAYAGFVILLTGIGLTT
jgi:hypothetical protein